MCFNCPDGTFLPDCRDKRSRKTSLSDAKQTDAQINPEINTGLGFSRVAIIHCANELNDNQVETTKACKNILLARKLRSKYLFKREAEPWETELKTTPNMKKVLYKMSSEGVYEVSEVDDDTHTNLFPTKQLSEFITDYNSLKKICEDGVTNSMAYAQLKSMELQYSMHQHLNAVLEDKSSELGDKADFFSIGKVDTHIHLAAAFSPQDFVQYIKQKVREDSPEPVFQGKSLGKVMKDVGLSEEQLTLDVIDVQADHTLFNRFDRFNAKYNPAGNSSLRTIFLKAENEIEGKYFAELTKIALSRLESTKTCFAEYRMSVYGAAKDDWTKVAKWTYDSNLCDHPNNKWMVQLPRIYRIFKKIGKVANFGQTMENFFAPLFEATNNPEADPKLAKLLENLSGFDSVDDESLADAHLEEVSPLEWDRAENPAYAYQLYVFQANLSVLNKLRERKGMNTFSFRPHCGESGDVMHLAAAFMLCGGVSHGVNLNKNPTLEYLFYLEQIGIAVSPTSNNFLFLKMKDSPFDKMFKRGLNVSISTDDPMLFHLSHHPLLEEYSICRQFWSYSITDLSEIANNSCRQSGFDHAWKMQWIGINYFEHGAKRNVPDKTNIPMIRSQFREETWETQNTFVEKNAAGTYKLLQCQHQSSFDLFKQADKREELEKRNHELEKELSELKKLIKKG